MIESGVWIILLEAAVALGLLVFIVWWTLPRGDRDSAGTREREADGDVSAGRAERKE